MPTGIRLLVRRCCSAVLTMEKFEGAAEVSVSFVDNEQIRQLNREFRDKDAANAVMLAWATSSSRCRAPSSRRRCTAIRCAGRSVF